MGFALRGRSFYGNLRVLYGIGRLRTSGKGSNSPLEKGLWDARCIFWDRPYADNKSRKRATDTSIQPRRSPYSYWEAARREPTHKCCAGSSNRAMCSTTR